MAILSCSTVHLSYQTTLFRLRSWLTQASVIPMCPLDIANRLLSTSRVRTQFYYVDLPNGTYLTSEKDVNALYQIDTFCSRIKARVAPLDGYDVIFCMDWLKTRNPRIDFVTTQVKIRDDKGKPHLPTSDRCQRAVDNPTSNVISHKLFKEIMKSFHYSHLCHGLDGGPKTVRVRSGIFLLTRN